MTRFRSWISGLVVACLLCGLSQADEASERPAPVRLAPLRLALLDFEDLAGFQGEWTLAQNVPELLGRYLDGEDVFDVIPRGRVVEAQASSDVANLLGRHRAVAVGRQLEADIVIHGVVETFGMRRTSAGDPNLAGYKSYRSVVGLSEVEVIRVATGQLIGTVEVMRDSTERPLGLDLFGRPRRQDREFRELFTLKFGSERFFELPLGTVTDAAFTDLQRDIATLLGDRPPIDLSSGKAVVLAVDEDEVYLGIGVDDNVEYGDLLPLFGDDPARVDDRIGLVQVREVIGPHLCKAEIVEGSELVEAGSRIGQRISRGETTE
ncbi:MAG: hypothetical protein VX733_05095 [Candidatus Latescibacterota bacterium]|nr:hypothetical protein [Candidatus Latescibacterota bacterium]